MRDRRFAQSGEAQTAATAKAGAGATQHLWLTVTPEAAK